MGFEMKTKDSTIEAIKEIARNKAISMKASKDHTTKGIRNAIKEVEGKNKTIKKKITAYCNEIKQEIQKLE